MGKWGRESGTLIFLASRRHQQLQFRPSLEELRAKYYREMKKFICIPLHFRGVGEASSAALTIFPRMISRNAGGFTTVYRKVGELEHCSVASMFLMRSCTGVYVYI